MLLPRIRPVTILLAALAAVAGALPAQDEEWADPIAELTSEGRWEDALPLAQKLEQEWNAAVRRNDELKQRLYWARSLTVLGVVEDRLNMFEPSLKHLRLARDLVVEAHADAESAGDVLYHLGHTEFRSGHYPEAEKTLRSAVEQLQQLPPEQQEPWLSASRDDLAFLALKTGRYEEAGQILHETLEAAAAGDDKRVLSQRHHYLGKYYYTIRSYATACEHYKRAHELAVETLGEGHPDFISLKGNLGMAYLRLAPSGETIEEARALLEEAAELAAAQPRTHETALALAIYLNNLGLLALLQGDHHEALRIYSNSLDTLKPRLSSSSPIIALFYNNIGHANQFLKNHRAAQEAYNQAAARYLQSVGTGHPLYIEVSTNAILNLLLAGEPTAAVAGKVEEAARAQLAVFEHVLAFGTERQHLNYLWRENFASLPCTLGRDPLLVANTILRTKGRVLDRILAGKQEETGGLHEELRAKQRQLDDLLFRFEGGETLQRLRDEITSLVAQLGSEPSRPVPQAATVTWESVQATLPEHGAFVDFVRYRNYNAGVDGPLAYGAVLVLPAGEPKWVPLGSERELETWLGIMKERLDYRAHLLGSRKPAGPPALRLRSALLRLHELFWQPVENELPAGTESVALSPDGTLNFVSFAVLMDDSGQLLARKFRNVVYVSSGRDLLAGGPRRGLADGPWAMVAVPEFEAVPDAGESTLASARDQKVLETIRSFPPVPGAREELRLLRRLTPRASRGVELVNATEEQLRGLAGSPAVLHLATHGFFLPADHDASMTGVQDFDYNPEHFYRSGLVLTEAKRSLARRARGEAVPYQQDGIVYSDELRDLPLENTRLVTISSCESGLGEALVSGQGVLGLRQGFTIAGAQNILLSLWPVSDNSTPKFMETLYRLALSTDRVGQSLWETQRRAFAGIDPEDDAALEEAVLRYGCFVLCQRGPLEAAVTMPELTRPINSTWAVVGGLGAAGLAAVLLLGRRRKEG